MKAIQEHKQSWRVAGLALLILALIGPWVYEVIFVPAEYSCSPPNIRLEGDYCGAPMPGAWIIFGFAQGFLSLNIDLLIGTEVFAERTREYFFMLLSSLSVLPFISTLLVLWKRDTRKLRKFHLVAWGLAVVLGLFWSLSMLFASHPHIGRLWGLWAYLGLAIGMLVLEAFALVAEKGIGQ